MWVCVCWGSGCRELSEWQSWEKLSAYLYACVCVCEYFSYICSGCFHIVCVCGCSHVCVCVGVHVCTCLPAYVSLFNLKAWGLWKRAGQKILYESETILSSFARWISLSFFLSLSPSFSLHLLLIFFVFLRLFTAVAKFWHSCLIFLQLSIFWAFKVSDRYKFGLVVSQSHAHIAIHCSTYSWQHHMLCKQLC